MSYIEWNNKLSKHFFNPDMAGREVLLFVDELLINEMALEMGHEVEGFVSSVIHGPFKKKDPNVGICQNAMRLYQGWRLKNLEYPPYIAYLALFVMAGCIEDDSYSQIAYYPKLRKLLMEDETLGQHPRFNEMHLLWEDLEKWSKEDKIEEFGRFTVKTRGRRRHIGLPLSQSIISTKERGLLPLIFHKGDLIPTSLPEDEILQNVLTEHGQTHLSRKTMRLLLGEEDNKELLAALLEFIREDLSQWDGSLPADATGATSSVRSSVMLCLDLDKIKKKVNLSCRIKSNNMFPEEPLQLILRGKKGSFSCKGSIENWSTELKDNQNNLLNSTSFDLRNNAVFEDADNKWSAKFDGSTVHVFVRGQRFGLPNGFVEIKRLEKGLQFFLLCHRSVVDEVSKWGGQSCKTFGLLTYSGLPEQWNLFHGENPQASCIGVQQLTLSSNSKIRLVGGIRLGYGNTYIHIAPPDIVTENLESQEAVRLNSQRLEYNLDKECWVLPDNLPINEPLTVSVRETGEQQKQIVFKLVKPVVHTKNKEHFFYESKMNGDIYTIGANVYGDNNDIEPFSYDLPTYLSNEIIFIGKKLGEVSHWTKSTSIKLPWYPVWAISKEGRKKWKIHFCGRESLKRCKPSKGSGSEKDITQWKLALREMDKIADKSDLNFDTLQELWNDYLEVTRDA